MKPVLNTSAALEAKLYELEAMQKDLAEAAAAVRVKLEKARRQERANGARRKAFDCEAEEARPRRAYTPLDWSAADKPAPPLYQPINWREKLAELDGKVFVCFEEGCRNHRLCPEDVAAILEIHAEHRRRNK